MEENNEKIKTGLIHGSFDMLETRDVDAINLAKEECEVLVVGVYSDEMYERLNGKKPAFSAEKRKELAESIKGVNYTIIIEDQEQLYNKERKKELLKLIKKEKIKKKQEKNRVGSSKKKYEVGFVQGTMDMFHFGHLNLIKRAKKYCNKLIVGVNSDLLVQEYKHKRTIVNQEDRIRIVESIKGVDRVVMTEDRDKIAEQKKYGFNVIVSGDDWKGEYNKEEAELKKINVDMIFLRRTPGVSSTDITEEYLKRKNLKNKDISKEEEK